MSPHRSAWAVAVVVALAGPGVADARDACPDGIFVTADTPFSTATGAAVAAAVVLEAGRVTIADLCADAAEAKVRAKKRFDAVKARWSGCGAFPGTVMLNAKVDAADCRTMTGVLRPKKTTPKKQAFTATRLSEAALALVDTLGTDAVAARMQRENFPYLIHPAAEAYNPELADLVALGPDGVAAAAAEFRQAADLADETRLSLLAVALERLGDPRAVPVLRDWLQENLFTAALLWAPHLVTHAMKVLAGQDGVDDESFTYDVEEMLSAIGRTRLTASPRAATVAAVRRLAATDRVPNNCQQTIVVTGLDGDGQPAELRIPYATFTKDIHELIAEETDPDRRAALEKNRDRWRAVDEEVYGGTDYVPADAGGDVSLRSNCGGSVVQRMLNEVARLNGLPIRLGPGAAGADLARELARTFGGEVSIAQLQPLLGMISHDRADGQSAHVEIPIERLDAENLLVFSKDVQGLARRHVVDQNDVLNAFAVVRDAYNFRPFNDYDETTTSFAQIDPSRVHDIRLDSSGCPCGFGGGVEVTLTAPAGAEIGAQTTTVAGTVDDPSVPLVTVRLNGRLASVPVQNGSFATAVSFRTGDNDLQVVADSPGGGRGCVERTVRAPCDFTDPDTPFEGGGWVRLSVDGGPELEWPGYTGISILSRPRAIVWFGAPPTAEPHILFELYGPRALRPGRFEVRPRPTTEEAFARTYAVGSFRPERAVAGMRHRHELVGGELHVEEIETGRTRRLRARFDVTALSDDDGTTRRVVGSVDLCRYGIERSGGRIDLAD